MAFEKGTGMSAAISPADAYGQYAETRMAAPTFVQKLFGSVGQSSGTGWAFDVSQDMPGVTGADPVYQDEIMRIAAGIQPHPDQYLVTDRQDGSEWFGGAMNIVGAMVDRAMGVPSETANPLQPTPVLFGGQQSSGVDVKTLGLFAGGAVLVYLLAKAA